MATNSKLIGVTFQKWEGMGIVQGDPEISDGDNGQVAALNLLTIARVPQENGQWVDEEQVIPVIVMNPKRVEKLIIPYVKDRRQLYITGFLKIWDGGFAIQAQDIQLGNPNTNKKD